MAARNLEVLRPVASTAQGLVWFYVREDSSHPKVLLELPTGAEPGSVWEAGSITEDALAHRRTGRRQDIGHDYVKWGRQIIVNAKEYSRFIAVEVERECCGDAVPPMSLYCPLCGSAMSSFLLPWRASTNTVIIDPEIS